MARPSSSFAVHRTVFHFSDGDCDRCSPRDYRKVSFHTELIESSIPRPPIGGGAPFDHWSSLQRFAGGREHERRRVWKEDEA
jgi:hypothetical protein